jgi:orotate phosphoribosyltransferase
MTMSYATRIAEYLLSTSAVKLSPSDPFTWASGIKSPIYCDNRVLYSYPEARDFLVSALVTRVKALHIQPDTIAGTATAAIGWAALVADRMKLPFVYVRSKPKDHGTQKLIEGHLTPDQHVVVIEDLISTAKSSAHTVDALRTEGKAVVTDVVAIFHYGLLSAGDKAQEMNVRLHSLTGLADLLKIAQERDELSDEQVEEVLAFAKNPEGWRG